MPIVSAPPPDPTDPNKILYEILVNNGIKASHNGVEKSGTFKEVIELDDHPPVICVNSGTYSNPLDIGRITNSLIEYFKDNGYYIRGLPQINSHQVGQIHATMIFERPSDSVNMSDLPEISRSSWSAHPSDIQPS